MENIKYLSENELKGIADTISFYLNKDVKKTLKRLETKYKIEFTTSKKLNTNLLWQSYAEEIKTDTHKDIRYNKTFAEAFKMTNGINIEARDILVTYIKYNHKEDYEFINEFDVDGILRNINTVLSSAGFYYHSESLKELLNTNDYYSFFNSLYGIGAVSSKAMKATKKAIENFNQLIGDIPNKAGFFIALATYYQTNDLNQLHNSIHTKFE